MSDSRGCKGGTNSGFSGLGKTHQMIGGPGEKCPGSVPPKYIPNKFRFRNLKISGQFAADFPFVVDDSLKLLTNFFTHRKIPWSQPQLAGIERFDPPFGGWQTGRTCQDGPSCLGGVVLFCQGVLKGGETTMLKGWASWLVG